MGRPIESIGFPMGKEYTASLPDVWKIEIFKIPEAILGRLEEENVSKWMRNGL